MAAKKITTEFPLAFLNFNDITFIPLHKNRENWRGFNQSEILAEKIAVKHNFLHHKILARKKNTRTQKDLKKKSREENIKDAFMLSPDFKSSQIKNKNIILIDDVVTTGSTFLEAAKVLRKNGSGAVLCIAFARD